MLFGFVSMHISEKAVILLLGISISGCASKYLEPQDSSRAKITYNVLANTPDLQIFLYENYDCNKPQMMASLKKQSSDQAVTTYVSSKKPLINSFRVLSNNGWYFSAIEFGPEQNGSYVVTVNGSNFLNIVTMRASAGSLALEPTAKKPEKVCKW